MIATVKTSLAARLFRNNPKNTDLVTTQLIEQHGLTDEEILTGLAMSAGFIPIPDLGEAMVAA
jgi:hypothetical protein